MPQLMAVRVSRPEGRPIRIWIPVLPVLLILSPFVIVAVLVIAVACVVYRMNPVRALAGGWRLFCALRGTRVDVEQGRTAVLVSIR